jgi:outer membrane protein OmpA-like peptidoglycan-associated protein
VEASAFFGASSLSDTLALGAAAQPDERPQTAPMFGARLGYVVGPWSPIQLVAEAELSFTPSWTGYDFAAERDSYFAPLFGWRGGLLVRLAARPGVWPHVEVGGGGATLVSHSPYLTDQTDGVFYWGLGATIAVGPRWQLRVDGRQTVMPAVGGGATESYELVAGIQLPLGTSDASDSIVIVDDPPAPPPPPPAPPPAPAPVVATTPPPPPDPDADHDGIPVDRDRCPDQPETINGYQDADGCPDAIPAAIAAALEDASTVRFEPRRARITNAAKRALERTVHALRDNPTLHVRITSHPEGNDAALAQKRAEAVQWYLVDRGVSTDQLAIVIGAQAAPQRPVIELAVTPH